MGVSPLLSFHPHSSHLDDNWPRLRGVNEMDLALIVLRLSVGLLLVGHGAQKLFGWFGGHGLHGTAQWLASIGFRPARAWALLAGILEFGGGLLFTLGLVTPLGRSEPGHRC